MNLPIENASLGPLEDGLFDRLADGTLNEADRRALLLRLDAEPNGWRRCALAFLQEQAIEEAMEATGSKIQAFKIQERKRKPLMRWALAASALIATFGIGLVSGTRLQSAPAVENSNVATTNEPPKKAVEAIPIAKPEAPVARTVAYLEVTDADKQTVRVPVWSGPGLDERWLQNQPSALSAQNRLRWERLGYAVEEDRRYVSLKLRDGRSVSFPVNQVQLKYVGKPTL